MADKATTPRDIEEYVLRVDNLDGRESPYRPVDMMLERFQRSRYSVVGRPAEQTGPLTPLEEVDAFNLTYLKCEPGKGIGTHAHATPELFIVMKGTWKIWLGENAGQETVIGPWDIISVPPNEMHGASNISDEEGWMMTINAGHGGAKIHWALNLVEELRASGHDVPDNEMPGETTGRR